MVKKLGKKSQKKNELWYLYPLDSDTNNAIAADCQPEDFVEEVKCADGSKRPMWECSTAIKDMLVNSKKQKGLRFEVFPADTVPNPS